MLRLSSVLFGLIATVLAGVGLTVVLMVPAWSDHATAYIPYSVAVAFVLAIPVTWLVAREIIRQTQH